jgi:cytochrome c553
MMTLRLQKSRTALNLIIVSGLATSIPATLMAKGNVEAGQKKSAVCSTCHGTDGQSTDPNFPNLAGQHQSYLVKAMSDYRSSKRTNPVMAGFSANLTNQDIEDLAAWYASQKGLEDLSIK